MPPVDRQPVPDMLRERSGVVREALGRLLTAPDDPSRDLYEAMRYMVLGGGKKLRPVLVLLAAEACGGTAEAALPAACAIEMVHTYSLIHDDLPAMDNDDLRHGKPSCHKAYGEAMAILAGDGLLTEAFAVLAWPGRDPAVAQRLVAELAEAAGPTGMVGGQVADLKAEREHLGDARLLETIHRRKTARMIEAAAAMGAIAAGASRHVERSLRAYGQHLGLAFQIADDILDAEGTTEALGKTAGKDAAAGKLTYVGCYGLAAARDRARVEAEGAMSALAGFGHAADVLRDLARFVVERTF